MKCPVCLSHKPLPLSGVGKGAYLSCPDCSFVFTQDDNKNVIYDAQYSSSRGHSGFESPITCAKEESAKFYLRKLKHKPDTGASLLDVGCSTGIMLKAARGMGYCICGIDINPQAVSLAKDYLKDENIHCADICNMDWKEKFDVVMMMDSIEHFRGPGSVLKKAHCFLKDGGELLIVTPDISSLSFKLLKSKWFHFLPEHVSFFNRSSLEKALKASGFRIRMIRGAQKFVSLEIVRRHMQIHRHVFMAGLIARLLGLVPEGIRGRSFKIKMGEIYALAEK